MKKSIAFVLFIILLLSFTSCKPDINVAAEEALKDVRSSASDLTIKVPASWVKTEENADASIEMADDFNGFSIVVIEESAELFVDGFTLGEFTALALGSIEQAIESKVDPVIKDVLIGGAIPAKQYEISGSLEGVKVKFLITNVRVNGLFYQFSCSAIEKDYDAVKPVFEKILRSADFGANAIVDEPVPLAEYHEEEEIEEKFQRVESKESDFSLEFPEYWTEGSDIDWATLEMDDPVNGFYFCVAEEKRSDFVSGFSLDKYTDSYADIMIKHLGQTDKPEAVDIEIDGIPAKQFEVSGTQDNMNVTYLVVCAEANELFYHMRMYTILSMYEEAKLVFEQIIQSASFGQDTSMTRASELADSNDTWADYRQSDKSKLLDRIEAAGEMSGWADNSKLREKIKAVRELFERRE